VKRAGIRALLGSALLLASCTAGSTPSPSAASTSAPATSGASTGASPARSSPKAAKDIVIPKPSGSLTVNIGTPSALSLLTVPAQMTVDRLNAEGWKATLTPFTATNLNTQALAQGNVQFSVAQVLDAARAIQAGGQISWLGEHAGAEFTLGALNSIADCKGLDGKRVGVQGLASPIAVAMNDYFSACGAKPELLAVSGGENRGVAMEKGQLDAASFQYADWLTLDARSPGKFHLIETGTTFDTIGFAVWANEPWASQNRDLATAFYAEMLKTYAMIHEDQSILATAMSKYLSSIPAGIQSSLIATYLTKVHAWPANAGNVQSLAASLAFSTKSGDLKPGLDANALVDGTVRNGALRLVGQAT
jgi:ABC-type nitrate/sulfonate/bicarbonate transport system substrate-binding protein